MGELANGTVGTSQQISQATKITFYVILVVIIPMIGILGPELAGRVMMFATHGVSGKSYGLWQYDRELGAVHASHAYNSNSVTNNLGFRNEEDIIDRKEAGTLRIIAYGGSATFCYNLQTRLAWPIQLQERLRTSRGRPHQVMNAGAIMWSHSHELARARRDLPRLTPDYVIIYTGINEEANLHFLRADGVNVDEEIANGKTGLLATNLDQTRIHRITH